MVSVEAAEQAMVAAFEIANARGASLLVALGRFDAWRGDLASMRGDTGASTIADRPMTVDVPANDGGDVLIVARALRSLSPRCRETLFLRYVERLDGKQIARALKTTEKGAATVGTNCFNRMMQTIESLGEGAGPLPSQRPATPGSSTGEHSMPGKR
jgi:DNA-directed RNA polymerase specialized sigma24 family protein